MRRPFWVALGLGAGAAGAVMTSRWAKRQARKVAPATIAREARGGLLELGKLMSESIAEGRQAMQERERELRTEVLGRPDPASPGDADLPGHPDQPDQPAA